MECVGCTACLQDRHFGWGWKRRHHVLHSAADVSVHPLLQAGSAVRHARHVLHWQAAAQYPTQGGLHGQSQWVLVPQGGEALVAALGLRLIKAPLCSSQCSVASSRVVSVPNIDEITRCVVFKRGRPPLATCSGQLRCPDLPGADAQHHRASSGQVQEEPRCACAEGS